MGNAEYMEAVVTISCLQMELLYRVIFFVLLQQKTVMGIQCYVGLGSDDIKPVIECPEERRYVCVTMYFVEWPQIKMYCDQMVPEDYEDILDNEAMVSEGLIESDEHPNCKNVMDRGRQVIICSVMVPLQIDSASDVV